MGWNSWDSYGLTIDEAEFTANVNWMAARLRMFGWEYAVVDEGWYLRNPLNNGHPAWEFNLDDKSRFVPDPERFASASDGQGFKRLADYVHSRGLKFGVHIIRGIPREAVARNMAISDSPYRASDAADPSDTCPWNPDTFGVRNNAAGQAYYDSVAKLYARWGLDFIKVDCISSRPHKADEVRMISNALRKTGRQIVLSLSPGPTSLAVADEVREYAQMWRISSDFWDYWNTPVDQPWVQTLNGQFATLIAWAPFVSAGHWPDADMLPIGHIGPRPGLGPDRQTRFTHDEQVTLLTLWSIARSPLMLGGDLPHSDDWTLSLLTNPEVIAVDQESTHNRSLITTNSTVIWSADCGQSRGTYLAIFNRGDSAKDINLEWNEVGLDSNVRYHVRDLWQHQDLGLASFLGVKLRPHASVLYLVTP
jgi:hypothetical protein